MADWGIMLLLVAAMLFFVVYRGKYHPEGNPGFFDGDNTKAMRGFWCLIVMLVHIPTAYQNRIQDLLGSFAFVGVTFYYMTSAFGLSRKFSDSSQNTKAFWRKRLPKLLIPQLLVNLSFSIVAFLALGDAVTVRAIVHVNAWVVWLLVCYLILWLSHRILKDPGKKCLFICALVGAFSLTVYLLHAAGLTSVTIWSTEVVGFIWGALLGLLYEPVKACFAGKWLGKCAVSCGVAGGLGVLYLLFKPVPFFGDYLLKILLGVAIILFILILNARFSIGNRVIWFFGEISFEFYLIHFEVIALLSAKGQNFGSGVFILLCLGLTTVCSAAVHFVASKILDHLYQKVPFFRKK